MARPMGKAVDFFLALISATETRQVWGLHGLVLWIMCG